MSERNLLFGGGEVKKPRKSLFEAVEKVNDTILEKPKPLFANVSPACRPMIDSCPDPEPVVKRNGPMFKNAIIRRRVEATIDDLRKFSQDESVLKKSLKQILETNIDDLCLKYVLNWGADIQKEYSDIVDNIMNISTSKDIGDIKNKILGIIEKITEMDIEDVMKKSFFQSKESKIEKMKEAMEELRQEVRNISTNKLEDIYNSMNHTKTLIEGILEKIEPYIITCQFYSEHVKDGFPNHLYISRLQSLLSTKVGAGNDMITVTHLEGAIISIIDTINNVMRNEIPAWCSNFSAVVVGSMDMSTLKQVQENILLKLKTSIK